jgi:hypothetical protein
MSDPTHPGRELGRRVQDLHHAAKQIAAIVDECAHTQKLRGRLLDAHYRQAFRDLFASQPFRRLVAELAAFEGFVRHHDPRAEIPPAAVVLEREGDYTLDGLPRDAQDLQALANFRPPARADRR